MGASQEATFDVKHNAKRKGKMGANNTPTQRERLTGAKICFVSPNSIHAYRWIDAFSLKEYNLALITDSTAWVAPEIRSASVYVLPPLTRKTLPQLALPNTLAMARILKAVKPDIVSLHVQYYYASAVIANRLPFALTSWGIEVLQLPNENPILKTMAKIAATKSRVVIVDAEVLKKIWVRLGIVERKIRVIPFGVDTKLFSPDIDGGSVRRSLKIEKTDTVIISTRPFYNHKYNVVCLIRTIPKVVEEHPDTIFILKGSGPLESYFKRLVKKLGVENHVRWVGIVSYDKQAQYLRAADIYVSTCYVDTTSVSLLEAMACALPPIVTDIEGNREWVANEINGLLYSPKDSTVLAQKIIHLVRDSTLRKRFGERSRQIVRERATWQRCVEEMEEIYQSMLKQ